MIGWIQSLSAHLQVIVILGLAFCLVVIFHKILDNNYAIRSKFFSFGKKDSTEKSLVIFLNEISILINEKTRLSEFEAIRRQMTFAEDKANEIVSMMQITYINKLKELKEKDPIKNHSFASYRLCLFFMKKELLSKTRTYFRDNHFAKMSETKFYDYAFDKTNSICNEATEILNEIYFYDEIINREENYHMNLKNLEDIKKIIINVFMKAREIAIETVQKSKNIDKQIQELLKKNLEA
jgi:hypothetical protein